MKKSPSGRHQSIYFLKNINPVFGVSWLPETRKMQRLGLSPNFDDARKISTKSAASQIISYWPNYKKANWVLVEFVLYASGVTEVVEHTWMD